MRLNKKYLIIILSFILIIIAVIIYSSLLSAPADKVTGNLILGRFNPADYKLNTVGEVIKKDTNEVITKRSYNSKTYQNPDSSYTAVIGGGSVFFFDREDYVEMENRKN